MLKVNNKDTRTSLCSSVSIVNFEQVNVGWVVNTFSLRDQVNVMF